MLLRGHYLSADPSCCQPLRRWWCLPRCHCCHHDIFPWFRHENQIRCCWRCWWPHAFLQMVLQWDAVLLPLYLQHRNYVKCAVLPIHNRRNVHALSATTGINARIFTLRIRGAGQPLQMAS